MHYDPLECWRTLGVAKFTDTGKALKQWCVETHEQYSKEVKQAKGRKDTSFASDASDAEKNSSLEAFTTFTKMII